MLRQPVASAHFGSTRGPLVCADSAADWRDGGPMSAATGAMSVQPVLRVAETCWCAPEQLAWVCMLRQPLVSAHFCSRRGPLVCADSAADRRDHGPMSAATGAMSVQPVLCVAETCWCAP